VPIDEPMFVSLPHIQLFKSYQISWHLRTADAAASDNYIKEKMHSANKYVNNHIRQDCSSCPVRVHCVYNFLNMQQRTELENNMKCLERKKGAVLYNEGFAATDFFMLIKGIVKKTTQVKEVGEVILNFNKAGDFIGLNAVGSESVYTNSIVAFSDVKFCMFSDYLIVRFMKENTGVFDFVTSRFSDYTESVRKRMISLLYRNSKKRIAESLIMLHEQIKNDKNHIDASREDLASLAGTTRETVSRVLSKFKSGKIISFDKRIIVIEQLEKLRVFSST
jgi:CRP-like cAMP-binding protein